MSGSTAAPPFPLGAYLGNPDNSSLGNQALFDAKYNSFATLMGAAPKYLDFFVDQTQPISQWIGNSTWSADSASQSANAKGAVPVIALPMSSTAAGSLTSQQQFQAFASGQYDDVIKGIVQTWAQRGFTNVAFRPGWEMNIGGPTYAGDSAQSEADWVRAFQHISTVLHQAATANGVAVQVVWNPSVINYSNALATTNLYPGDDAVDVVGADMYSDIYPYSDGGTTAAYHDWNTGLADTTVAAFIADPVNRQHYWSFPAATVWQNDSSGGHSLSLTNLIDFAKLHNKPFALPETGAGNSNAGTDVPDDAAFPQWLAQQLAAAQAAGVKIAFANIWDSNGGGNYQFSLPGDGKPGEAAAWAQYLGVPQTGGPQPATVTLGYGPDTLALLVAEDAWQGDALFTISVNGKQIGGTQTAAASHGAGQLQKFNVLGSFGGSNIATVNFLNDGYGGSASADRNLYVASAKIDGVAVPSSALTLLAAGPQSFSFNGPAAATTDTLDLHLSEDAWQGDAQYTVAIDGATIGGVRTASASHATGATQDVAIAGNWGGGPHSIGVTFLNDGYGGTSGADRNLYVDQATYDGQAASGAPAALFWNRTAAFTVTSTASVTPLTLHLAEDAWQGDAQYSVSIDGALLVQNGTVIASNAQGVSQAVNLQATLSAGKHDLAISFLNDAYGGSAAADRNLYVKGIDVSGKPVPGAIVSLLSTGTTHFQILTPVA